MRSPNLLRARTPALVALAALIAMLGVHSVLRANDDLSPWKGAGFAMFSTVDSPGMRTVAVWADVRGAKVRVDLAESWDGAIGELRSLPTPARTMALARRVASSTLVRRDDGTLTVETTSPVPALVPAGGRSVSQTETAITARRAVVEVDRVRVDVTKLTYVDGRVRATLVQSALSDVALEQ